MNTAQRRAAKPLVTGEDGGVWSCKCERCGRKAHIYAKNKAMAIECFRQLDWAVWRNKRAVYSRALCPECSRESARQQPLTLIRNEESNSRRNARKGH